MGEVPILIIIRFDKLGYNDGNLFTRELFIVLFHQMLDQLPIILLEDEIIEHKMVDGLIDLGEQSLHFLSCDHEVFIHHLFEISSLLVGRVQVLAHNVPNLLKCQDVMSSLVFLVMANASLHLANSGLVGTCQATAHLHHSVFVDGAEEFLVLGVS